MIDKLMQAVRGAGLKPDGIDLNAFALVRMLGSGQRDRSEADQPARVLCHLGGRDEPGHRCRPGVPVHPPAADRLEPRRRGRGQLPRPRRSGCRIDFHLAQANATPADSIVLSGPGAQRPAARRGPGARGPASRVGRRAPRAVRRRTPCPAATTLPVHRGRRPGAGCGQLMRAVNLLPAADRARVVKPAPAGRLAVAAGRARRRWCWRCSSWSSARTRSPIASRRSRSSTPRQQAGAAAVVRRSGSFGRVHPDQGDPREVGQRAGQDSLRLGAPDARAGAGPARERLGRPRSTASGTGAPDAAGGAEPDVGARPDAAATPTVEIVGCATSQSARGRDDGAPAQPAPRRGRRPRRVHRARPQAAGGRSSGASSSTASERRGEAAAAGTTGSPRP